MAGAGIYCRSGHLFFGYLHSERGSRVRAHVVEAHAMNVQASLRLSCTASTTTSSCVTTRTRCKRTSDASPPAPKAATTSRAGKFSFLSPVSAPPLLVATAVKMALARTPLPRPAPPTLPSPLLSVGCGCRGSAGLAHVACLGSWSRRRCTTTTWARGCAACLLLCERTEVTGHNSRLTRPTLLPPHTHHTLFPWRAGCAFRLG